LEYPTTHLLAPVQPALTGFEAPAPVTPAVEPDHPAVVAGEHRSVRRGPRHRYWSLRDLSRRVWLGRGYELLRGLIRAGILPATRSTQSWWIDDADVQGLLATFEDRAGKVRAFRGLEAWLRERCYVAPLTPETEAALDAGRRGVAWRGHVYLPRNAWRVDFGPDGRVTYFHDSGDAGDAGAIIPPPAQAAA
jgi:hypothetical protein